MPVDKWGHKFLYLSKTGGFSWFQNDNFREDEKDGMLRLGKETDDCELIDEDTGEWEFPYLSDGDGLALSGPTGHHSGGESHGCEGFAYMVDGQFESDPPTFRFRKEMYHVNYDTDPKTGTWSHPLVPDRVSDSNNWYGYGWVRYNRKDGAKGTGHNTDDSVVCECWWNPDPEADPTNWVMLKRTEDKGGWGDGGESCDGDEDQIGVWTNIQFRFKSSSSDFSLHPIYPETNEGDNIHSIGDSDMSFQDCVDRGYGYKPDVPRDVEMKCVFKAFDNGQYRFKNISLREIDPTKSFGDDSENPPDNQPGSTTTIQGTLKLQNDINQNRTSSACAGAGGGGSGGSSKFYEVPVVEERALSDSTTFENRTRIVEHVSSSGSVVYGKIIKQIDIPLRKQGTPGASPTVHMKIWSSGGSVIYDSPTTFDPSTFTTSFVSKTFDFSGNTHVMVVGDRVGVEYTGTSSSNYVMAGYSDTNAVVNTTYQQYEAGVHESISDRELAMDMWE